MIQKIIGKISRIHEPPYGSGYVLRMADGTDAVVWDSDLSDQTVRLQLKSDIEAVSVALGEEI